MPQPIESRTSSMRTASVDPDLLSRASSIVSGVEEGSEYSYESYYAGEGSKGDTGAGAGAGALGGRPAEVRPPDSARSDYSAEYSEFDAAPAASRRPPPTPRRSTRARLCATSSPTPS